MSAPVPAGRVVSPAAALQFNDFDARDAVSPSRSAVNDRAGCDRLPP